MIKETAMKIDRRIEIAAGPDRLWTLLTEPAQVKRWIPQLLSDEPEDGSGETRVGLRTRMRLREGKKVVEYATVLTAVEKRAFLEMEMRGGNLGTSPMTVAYRLLPSSGGTVLVYQAVWRPRELLLTLLSPLIAVFARRSSSSQLRRLKDLAESA